MERAVVPLELLVGRYRISLFGKAALSAVRHKPGELLGIAEGQRPQ